MGHLQDFFFHSCIFIIHSNRFHRGIFFQYSPVPLHPFIYTCPFLFPTSILPSSILFPSLLRPGLTEPQVTLWTGWPASSRNPPVSASQPWSSGDHHYVQLFTWVWGIKTQAPNCSAGTLPAEPGLFLFLSGFIHRSIKVLKAVIAVFGGDKA